MNVLLGNENEAINEITTRVYKQETNPILFLSDEAVRVVTLLLEFAVTQSSAVTESMYTCYSCIQNGIVSY
jgi:hypothetical protein